MDSVIGAMIMALGAAGYWAVYRRTGDLLHPLGVLVLTWLLAFGFGHFDVARVYDEPYYADPFEAVTYGAALGSLLVFAAGFWLVDPKLERLEWARLSGRISASYDRERLAALILAFFVVASITTWYFVRLAGGIPLFSPLIGELRPIFKRPIIGYFYDLHVYVVLLGAVLLVSARTRGQALPWVALILAALVQLAFGAARGAPMTAWMFAAGAVFYMRPPRAWVRKAVVIGAVAASLFAGIEYFRRVPYRLDPSTMNTRLDLGPAATVWGHSGASFKNLQLVLLEDSPPLNLGMDSYDLPRTVLPELRQIEAELSARFGIHNSATYLVTLYLDFGIFGLLVVPGLYGAFTAFVYRQFRTRANLFWLLVYVEALLAVLLAFRTHRFVGNPLIFAVAVGALTQLLAGRSDPPAPVAEGAPPEAAPARR